MEKVYSIEEILSAFNDFQSKNKISKSEIKEKKNFIKEFSDIPKDTLRLIEEAEELKNK
tara:strand:+ start:1163 stop:1339 length:177 start_codon:yes stop_codon:yes gene_type:complete